MNRRTRKILRLALPIMGGMVSQNVMNLVDTAMVGHVGQAALAAVGMSSFAAFMSQAFVMGLATGVQAMAARRLGEERRGELAVPLNGGLLLAVALGVPMTVGLYLLAPLFYPYLNGDPAVIAIGVPYLQARLLGTIGVGLNFAFRGYFNGVNRSQLYMRSLIVMHVCNIVLDYGLIFGRLGMPELGAVGAGVGTTIATYVGTATYAVMAWRHARTAGFLRGMPDRATVAAMLEQALPSGVRQVFFAGGLTALFWIIGKVGTVELAASNVMVNLMLVAILPGLGLGLASASLVGQALGRGQPEDAMRWGWDVVKIAVGILGVIGLPMLLVPDLLFAVFKLSHEGVAAGRLAMRIIGASICIDGVGLVLQNAMLGAGDSRRVMVVSIVLQWLVFLPVAYLVGPVLGLGLVGIWGAMAGQRLVQAAVFGVLWQQGKWAEVTV